jgi:hypothetical protein
MFLKHRGGVPFPLPSLACARARARARTRAETNLSNIMIPYFYYYNPIGMSKCTAIQLVFLKNIFLFKNILKYFFIKINTLKLSDNT